MNSIKRERTIKQGERFRRVGLSSEELDEVHCMVMDHNVAVMRECLDEADKNFPELRPDERLQIGVLWADKLSVHIVTAEREALDRKISDIKDSANGGRPETSRQADSLARDERLKFQQFISSSMKRKELLGEPVGWQAIDSFTTAWVKKRGTVLVKVGVLPSCRPIYFAPTLLADGYSDQRPLIELVNEGLDRLTEPDQDDDEYVIHRSIEKAGVDAFMNGSMIWFQETQDSEVAAASGGRSSK